MLNEYQKEKLGYINKVTSSIQLLAVTILSVIIFADGVVEWILGNALFFGGVPAAFKVAIGFIAIVLAGKEE